MSAAKNGLDKKHCIHLKDGHFSADTETQAADIGSLLAAYGASDSPAGLVVHFHGGLVSYASGKGIAESLTPVYKAAGAYPVFFVWEAGPLEAIFNNLGDIGQEKIFREFVRKAIDFALRRLKGGVGAKGAGGETVNSQAVTRAVDEWFEGRSTAVPFEDFTLPGVADRTRTALAAMDDAMRIEIQAELEMDTRFLREIEAVSNGLLPPGESGSARGVGTRAATNTLMDPKALGELVDVPVRGKRGVISLMKVAAAIAKVVIRVVRRFIAGRDHGLYGTVVEEVLREFYVDKLGKCLLWNQMKKDTADAFMEKIEPGKEPGGTMFLKALADHLAKIGPGGARPRVTLVGHSTGAVYICNLLAAAGRWLPAGFKFDIILLAPAVSFERFSACMAANEKWVGGVRLFGMKDEVELKDAMAQGGLGPIARLVYPHSLLYFVSGILEDEEEDKPDHPILGMQRFFERKDVFGATDFPEVEQARRFFAAPPQRCAVWSEVHDGNGLASASKAHGDFDGDKVTLESVQWLLRNGFGA